MPHSPKDLSAAADPAACSALAADRAAPTAVLGVRIGAPLSVVRQRDATWLIADDRDEIVSGVDAPDWFALESNAGAVCVKRGFRRATWRVRTACGGAVYAKVFDDTGETFFERCRRRMAFSPAQREWRVLLTLRARGVSSIRPLALGIAGARTRRQVLLTEDMEGAAGLLDAWTSAMAMPEPSRRRRINALIDAVARLWAASHERGFAHPDGHPANVLVVVPEAEPLRAAYVDVAAGTLRLSRRPLKAGRALHSLAQLDQYFHRAATKTHRLRFWRIYWRQRPAAPESPSNPQEERQLLKRLGDASVVHAALLARQRDRRLRRTGKYFVRLSLGGGWRGVAAQALGRRHVFPEPGVPDRTADQWKELLQPIIEGHGRVSESRTSTIRVIRFHPVTVLAAIVESFRGSEARVVFERCHRLRHRDLEAPLILAYLERRGRASLMKESILVLPASNPK